MSQKVKSLPAVQETQVRSLGQEDALEKGNSYPLEYSGLENSLDCSKSQTRLSHFHFFGLPS